MKVRDSREVEATQLHVDGDNFGGAHTILTVNKHVGLFLNNNQLKSINDYLEKYRYYLSETNRRSHFRNGLNGRMINAISSMVEFMRTTNSFEVLVDENIIAQ